MVDGLNMIARFYSDLDPSDARHRYAADLLYPFVPTPDHIVYTLHTSYGPASSKPRAVFFEGCDCRRDWS